MPKLLVIGTMSYNFEDDKTGKVISGSKAYSFGKEDGRWIPVKASFKNIGTAEKLFPKPGIYEVELGFRGSVECAVLEKEIDFD